MLGSIVLEEEVPSDLHLSQVSPDFSEEEPVQGF
jgi:hypothetical protein